MPVSSTMMQSNRVWIPCRHLTMVTSGISDGDIPEELRERVSKSVFRVEEKGDAGVAGGTTGVPRG